MSRLFWVQDIPVAPGTPTRGEVEKIISQYPQNFLKRADVGMMQELMHPAAASSLKESIEEQIDKIPGYKDSRGMRPLRETIANYYELKYGIALDPDSIVVGLGASECFMATALGLLKKNDLVLTTAPYYPNHTAGLWAKGADWLAVPTKPEDNFHPNYGVLEKALKSTKKNVVSIYQSNPNNPTGAVLTENEIERTFLLQKKHDLIGLFDDVYSVHNFALDGRPDSFLQGFSKMGKKILNEALQNSIIFDSLSKKFGLADWRIGWAIIVNKKVRERIQPFISYRGSISGIMQTAAEKLIKKLSKNNFALEKEVNKLYKKKADDVYEGLKNMADIGVKVFYPPEGSIYLMSELPMKSFDLLKHSLSNPKDKSLKATFVPMTTPDGSFFPDPALGENLFRFCFGIPKNQISQAIALLRNQIESYKRFYPVNS